MPAPKFWAYVRMMPVLRAKNSIDRVNEMSAASGNMEQGTSQSYLFSLSNQANSTGSYSGAYKPKSAAEITALSEGGIKVIIEDKKT